MAICLFSVTANAKKNQKALVAYFSATNFTKGKAETLSKLIGADLYRITPAQPYTQEDLKWTDNNSRTSKEMRDMNSRPAIVKDLQDIDKYSTVYLGFPIWWYVAPPVISTFLDTYDLSGKTIVIFVTSGGATPEKALNQLKEQYPKLNFKKAELVNTATIKDLKHLAKYAK